MPKKQKEDSSSPFWSPEKKGDSISGGFMSFESGTFQDGKPSMQMLLNVNGNPAKIGLSAVLLNIVKSNIKQFKGNTKVTVTYDGLSKKKTKYGNYTKLFTLTVNGKKLEGSFVGAPLKTEKDVLEQIELMSKHE